MAILLKTTSVRVSSIQIMKVGVQNKGKSVWKSRYDGDISTHTPWRAAVPSGHPISRLGLFFSRKEAYIRKKIVLKF